LENSPEEGAVSLVSIVFATGRGGGLRNEVEAAGAGDAIGGATGGEGEGNEGGANWGGGGEGLLARDGGGAKVEVVFATRNKNNHIEINDIIRKI